MNSEDSGIVQIGRADHATAIDVAVIIVSYKTAQLSVRALKSLVGERSTPGLSLRAIVVDNASGDLPLIRQSVQDFGWSSWVALVEAPKNGGFAYGNNLGIRHAYETGTPSYVYILNPDTEVRPGAIGTLVQFLESNPRAGIAGGSFENADGSPWMIAFRFPGLVSEFAGGLRLGIVSRMLRRWEVARQMKGTDERVDWICGAAMLIRPAVFETIGGMDENYFLYFEETDFCRRAALAGFSTWYVPRSRVMHIAGQSTLVTERNARPKRLPTYWFESRRRYFAVSFGIARAVIIDVVSVLAHCLGSIKQLLVRTPSGAAVPFYVRDLIRNSVLWPGNRGVGDPVAPKFAGQGSRPS